jgi:hypothetical protein
MRKFGVVVVKPKNKGKGLLSCVAKEKKNYNLGCLIGERREYDYLGDVVRNFGDISSWRKCVMKESSVEIMLGFNKEEGVEDLRIEPKL